MFVVYILKSERDGKLYIGSTGNLERRFREHMNGCVASTKHRRPLALLYKEEYTTKIDAEERERYFKSGGRARNVLTQFIEKQKRTGA